MKQHFLLATLILLADCSNDSTSRTGRTKESTTHTTYATDSQKLPTAFKQSKNRIHKNSKPKCEMIIKDISFIRNLIKENNVEYSFIKPYTMKKIPYRNYHDNTVIDTIYRFSADSSLIELAKSFSARNASDPYSNWNLVIIKDGNIRLGNGLRVGSTKTAVERAFGMQIPSCDTIPFSTEDWTYDNYLVMRHDTVAEIYMAVTAD